MTVRKRRRVLTAPEDVAEHINANDYPASAPWEEWWAETAFYVEKLAGTDDFGFICQTANAAGVGLGDWFKKRLMRHIV